MPVTNYIWDVRHDSYLAETDETGATTVVYNNRPAQFGRLLSQNRGGETNYHKYDAQHSTRLLTDDTQAITDTYTYTAFGESVATTGSTENPFRYVGELGYYFDGEELGYYIRRRQYQFLIVRWLSLDPIEFLDCCSRYAFSHNSPGNMIDPSGMAPKGKFINDEHANDPAIGPLVYELSGFDSFFSYIQLFQLRITFQCDDGGTTRTFVDGADLLGSENLKIKPTFPDQHGINVKVVCGKTLSLLKDCKCCRGSWAAIMQFNWYQAILPRFAGGKKDDINVVAFNCDGRVFTTTERTLWTDYRLSNSLTLRDIGLSCINRASGTFTYDGTNCEIAVTEGPTTPDYS